MYDPQTLVIALTGGVGLDTNFGCRTMILTIYDHVRENAAVQVVL